MINLIKPVITEKSFDKASQGWYTFIVERHLTKNQARKLIADIFKVQVKEIKSAVFKATEKRSLRTRRVTKTGAYKKVMVHLGKDQKLDLFDVAANQG